MVFSSGTRVEGEFAHRAVAGVVRLLAEVRLAVLVLVVVLGVGDFGALLPVLATVPFSYVPARSWEKHGQLISRSGVLLASDLVATAVVAVLVPSPLSEVYVLATVTLFGVVVSWRLALVMAAPFVLFVLPLGGPANVGGWVFGVAVSATMAAMVFTGATLGDALRSQWAAAQVTAELRSRQAATAERVRIARDMHDTVAGDLAGAILVAQVLRDEVQRAGASPRVQGLSEQLVEQCLTAHGHTREAISALRRAESHPVDDLNELCRSWSERSAVPCEVEVAPELGEVDSALFADVRAMLLELLENVRRHSGAGSVQLAARVVGDELELRVTDDGCGFDFAEVAAARSLAGGHFGLVGIDERVESHAGSVVRSTPSRGGLETLIRLPLRQRERATV